MSDWQPAAYNVSLMLECLANHMTLDDINSAFSSRLPEGVVSEVLQVASELTESFHVAA
jgi:hypothetical protein